MAGVVIHNSTRRPVAPRAVFSVIASRVLPRWDISLVFVGPTKARALNKKLRNKTYTPNVLSYIAGEKSGEIIICPAVAARQASDYQLSPTNYLLLLFIHGLLHIKGWVHGDKMEQCERRLLARFAKGPVRSLSHETTHRNRHRHRHLPGKDSRRRRTLR